MNMQVFGLRALLVAAALGFFSLATPAALAAYTPWGSSDDPESFYACFYIGNIVDDPQSSYTCSGGNCTKDDPQADGATGLVDVNKMSFHDGRAIQLHAMGQLETNSHAYGVITQHAAIIADFARADKYVAESGEVEWHDGRVVSLIGEMLCNGNGGYDNRLDFPRRVTCGDTQNGRQYNASDFPGATATEDPDSPNIFDRMSPYLRPCCVASGADDQVQAFPCQAV